MLNLTKTINILATLSLFAAASAWGWFPMLKINEKSFCPKKALV